uniref:Uncharacterized protein n=1 Tax=Lepeophtheirus salmonis TaxID=72036 RepID=A0A0K2V2S9_LEPSM
MNSSAILYFEMECSIIIGLLFFKSPSINKA